MHHRVPTLTKSAPSLGAGKGFAKKRDLTFRPSSLGWRESERGGTPQAFPWKGKGDRRRRGMRLTSRQVEEDGAERGTVFFPF